MNDAAVEIAKANDVFMACIRSGDREGFMRLYTDDAIILPNGSPPIAGPEGAGVFFSALLSKGIAEVRLTTVEVEASDRFAWERGTSEAVSEAGETVGKGNYIVIWKRTSTGWKLFRDVMNIAVC